MPDIVLGEPIFVDSAIVAWAVNTAHHADFADRGHAHIYQEGLRIPPIRLYRAGELQQDVQELILLNCQVPRFSTNIKERRDCSTALFDRNGATLCQAEHIPMHLGSLRGPALRPSPRQSTTMRCQSPRP